jgi:hypothetical protein
MAAGIRALARKNGISGEMEETMEIRFGESERSELRRVPSISEQMALKVMEEGSRSVLNGAEHKSRKTPSLES